MQRWQPASALIPLLLCLLASTAHQAAAQSYEPLAPGSPLVAVSGDGSRVAFGGGDALGVVDPQRRVMTPLPTPSPRAIALIDLNLDGSLLAVHDPSQGRVFVFDVEGAVLTLSISTTGSVESLSFVPNTPWLALLSEGVVQLVNLGQADQVRALDVHPCDRGQLVASPVGDWLAIAGDGLCVLNLRTGVVRFRSLRGTAPSAAPSPDGSQIVVALGVPLEVDGRRANLLVLDLDTLGEGRLLSAAQTSNGVNFIRYVRWIAPGDLIVAIERFGHTHVVSAERGQWLGRVQSTIGSPLSYAVNPNGASVYLGHSGIRGYVTLDISSVVHAARAQALAIGELAVAIDQDIDAVLDVIATGSVGDVANLIAAGFDVNARDANGVTALMYAAASNSFEVVATLLRAGADATAVAPDGRTALHYAVESGGDPWSPAEIVRFGGDPSAADARGIAPSDLLPADVAVELLALFSSPSSAAGGRPAPATVGVSVIEAPADQVRATTQPEAAASSSGVGSQPPVGEPVVAQPPPEPVPAKVWVEFTSDPAGLELSVGGIALGRTPVRVELVRGQTVGYRVEGRLPDVHPFEGTITPLADAVHPTYMTRLTAAERSAYFAAQQPPPPPRPAPAAPSPAASPSPATPSQSTSQPSTRLFDSASGRPAPRPGESIRATPRYVVAFLANELEIREVACPPAPVPVIVCGITYDGEAMISSMVDALFDIYLQPSSREVRWYRDRGSNAYVGAFRRPEGVYAISIFGNTVSIGYVGP